MHRATLLVIAAAGLAACERAPDPAIERAQVGRALSGVLAYPRSTMVTYAAGEEAGELVLASPDSVAQVAAWFRVSLSLNGWEIQSDRPDRTGAVTLFAQKGTRPLWITLRPSVGGTGTTYTMVGAFAGTDSTAVQATDSVRP